MKSKYRLTSGRPIFLSHVVKVFNDYIGDRENSKMIRREWFFVCKERNLQVPVPLCIWPSAIEPKARASIELDIFVSLTWQ